MELSRRETEAVEQVRQSIHMAEQISLEKTQLELELNQSKQQLGMILNKMSLICIPVCIETPTSVSKIAQFLLS